MLAEKERHAAAGGHVFFQGLDGGRLQPFDVRQIDGRILAQRLEAQVAGRFHLRPNARPHRPAGGQGNVQVARVAGLGVAVDQQHGHVRRHVDHAIAVVVGVHRIALQAGRDLVRAGRGKMHHETALWRSGPAESPPA